MKASTLISNDDRIWIALGDCYAHLDNLGFAKRYYKRAARCVFIRIITKLHKIRKYTWRFFYELVKVTR